MWNLDFHVGYFERFDLPILLKPVCQVEGIVHFEFLKDIEASVKADFPARIRHNMSCMNRASAIKFPVKFYSGNRSDLFDCRKVCLLLVQVKFVRSCNQMDFHLGFGGLFLGHQLHQFHDISDLVEKSDVWIGNNNLVSTREPGPR